MAWPKEIPCKRYPSDLTDEEWEILEPILKKADPYTTGRPRQVDLREVLNAIFYLNKTGCQWRYLPRDFPHYNSYCKFSCDSILAYTNRSNLFSMLREC